MTKTEDARRVLKSYAMGQRAIEHDIAIVRRYAELSTADREQFRASFLNWFRLHAKIRALDWIGSAEFIFPRFSKYLNDGGELIANMRERQRIMEDLERQILALLVRSDEQSSSSVENLLRNYADMLQVFVEHREAIFAPVVLEHYNPEEEEVVEREFRNRLGISGSAYILPWMMFKATTEEREYLLSKMPLPFRWWLLKRWEPWYRKQIPVFMDR